MDANKFYDECDNLMYELQDATMFGDPLLDDLPAAGYTVVSARVEKFDSTEFSLEPYMRDYFNENLAPIEEDFCRYIYNVTGRLGTYNTKAEIICNEYNRMFPYDVTEDYRYAIYRYAFLHYGVKLLFDDFLEVYNDDLSFIKLFTFKYRYATRQDINDLRGKKDVDEDLIKEYSLNPLFTGPLASLEHVNKTEIAIHATNPMRLYEYLKNLLPGNLDMNFLGFILSHERSCELVQYIGKIPNDIFVQYNVKSLPTILKCYTMYGDNADFFKHYLTKYSCYDKILNKHIDDTEFMQACYKSVTELDWRIISTRLDNVQIDRKKFDSIKTRLVPALLEKKATYYDMVYYLVAESSDSLLAKFAQNLEELVPATKLAYEFIIKFFGNKINRVNESAYPKRYHLRYKSSKLTFSFSDLIAYPNKILGFLNQYNSFSTYIVSRREQGDMQLIFGEQSSLRALQEKVYTYENSVERFLDTKPVGEFTIEQIRRYNAFIHTATDLKDELFNVSENDYYYYDTVLDFINRYTGKDEDKLLLASALKCRNKVLYVGSLRAVLCYDSAQKRTLYFLYKLLSTLRPNSVVIASSVTAELEKIQFFVGVKPLLGVKPPLGADSLAQIASGFDTLVDALVASKFRSASINSGKDLIVTLKV